MILASRAEPNNPLSMRLARPSLHRYALRRREKGERRCLVKRLLGMGTSNENPLAGARVGHGRNGAAHFSDLGRHGGTRDSPAASNVARLARTLVAVPVGLPLASVSLATQSADGAAGSGVRRAAPV
jgi:hypothetical protein